MRWVPDWKRVVQSIPFRVLVSALVLCVHLGSFAWMAENRYGIAFNTAPGDEPRFELPTHHRPTNWDRLVVARWDAAHYMSIALRGYSQCPPGSLKSKDLSSVVTTCDVGFYPGYALLGKGVMWATGLPVDYALLAVSLACSFLFLFLWTGRTMVETFGLRVTWLAFLLFNTFSTGYTLVAILTEPPALLLTLCAFLALHRRWWLLGALLAGASTGLRVNAAGTGLAYALAVMVSFFVMRPNGVLAWIGRILAMPLAGWGVMTMMGYHWARFGDLLLYSNAHQQAYAHTPNPLSLLWPKIQWVLRGIDHPLHEVVVMALVGLVVLLGHRRALRGLAVVDQVYLYAQAILSLLISLIGSVEISFAGMNRYTLLALAVFFSIAALLQRRPLVLAFWLIASLFHYWQVDLCDYVGGVGPLRFNRCGVPQWLHSW